MQRTCRAYFLRSEKENQEHAFTSPMTFLPLGVLTIQVAPTLVAIISSRSGNYDWGYNENTAAGPRNQQSNANYWSSTRNGGNSYDLNFNSSNLNPRDTSYPGWGYTIRCVAQ